MLTVVTELGGSPEPLKLASSLKTLISSLVSSGGALTTEVARMHRATNLKVQCADSVLKGGTARDRAIRQSARR